MAELINRPQYLDQLIQNKDVDLVMRTLSGL